MKRVLLTSNHLFRWAGSELVVVELAEELQRQGLRVDVCAHEISGEVREHLAAATTNFFEDPEAVCLFDYDVVISLHSVLPRIFNAALKSGPSQNKTWPAFVFFHLSPFEPYEAPGPFIERRFADVVVANSQETAAELATYGGKFADAVVFANPAPLAFANSDSAPSKLKTLLAVSNHPPEEFAKACKILRSGGVKVHRIGRKNVPMRVTEGMIAQADAIFTIGKTAQYSFRTGRPVYCYDRFGGPGWLSADNFDKAAEFNFSGRCTNLKRSSHQIADEIVSGFEQAAAFADELKSSNLDRYRLEVCLAKLLEAAQTALDAKDRNARLDQMFANPDVHSEIKVEAASALLLSREFLRRRFLEKKREKKRQMFSFGRGAQRSILGVKAGRSA
ncbi:MAG: glycosyltransferase [Pseudomonadota bacterium]|nr:glycosyltransferase [Pseudomonadota bacterium]